jgi:prolyl oligopeptidase
MIVVRNFRTIAFSIVLLFSCFASASAQSISPASPSEPPKAPVRPVVEEYFGTKVTDPYRYMENLEDAEVKSWFKAQDDYTRSILAKIPGRQHLLERIKQLDQSAPAKVADVQRIQGDRYFYRKLLAGEEISKLYERDGLTGEEKLLVDPGKLSSAPGTHYSLDFFFPSGNGRYVTYGISISGSEDSVIHILDTSTGHDTGETIDRSWYGFPSWMPDHQSFLHNRLQKLPKGSNPDERRLKSAVYLHRVGTDPEKDVAVFGYGVYPEIKLEPSDASYVSTDPRTSYAIAIVQHGFMNESDFYIAPIASIGKPNLRWEKVCDTSEQVTFFEVRGDDLYLVTHKNAPRFKVIRTSLSHPNVSNAQVVIPEGEAVILAVVAAPDALYVQELDGGLGKLVRASYANYSLETVKLPVKGTLELFGGDPRLPNLVMGLSSWTTAYHIFKYDSGTKKVSDTGLVPAGPFDDPPDIEAEEVKAPTNSGTMIPLSIVHKKGMKLDGTNPTLLSGYGAYGISMQPFFSSRWLAWLERGGVFATAHVRGGGEYGEDWHQGGMLQNKPNTWGDFIACAEYLVKHGYTSPSKLAGQGGSAGGILIGRAFTERPDLFAAALDDVGLSDMIRDMFSPDGPLNEPEYGDLKTPAGFKNLLEISAYYQLVDGTHYPAVLLTTGMNDPRVVPWEPGKMAARLQAASSSKPVLLRVDYQGGHGGVGATKSQMEELAADQWSFLLWQFGDPEFQPKQ